ncbi:MAG: apolipoprotein N-acyltransferase [Bacteroidales bacterium]|nr:apolipoprotein N-acyltransferase [Bacteroidales bacterium]
MKEKKEIRLAIWGLIALFTLLTSIPFLVPGLGFIALVGFAPLFCLEKIITDNHVKGAWWLYYTAFLGFNIASTWWIWNVSPAGSVAAIILNALQMALIFLCFRAFKRHCTRGAKWIPYLFFIALWIAWEHIYVNIELSWPWLVLGNSLATSPKLAQWYEITGVEGGTLWILLCSWLTFIMIDGFSLGRRKAAHWAMAGLAALAIIPSCASLIRYYSYQEKGDAVECVLAQPNVDPFMKYGYIPQDQLDENLLKLFDTQITPETRYLITPETFTFDLDLNIPESNRSFNLFKGYMEGHAQATMLLGALTRKVYGPLAEKPSPSARKAGNIWYDVYNSAMTIGSEGLIEYYHKSKLVPGVEIIPYQNAFPWLGELLSKFGGSTSSYGTLSAMNAITGTDGNRVAPMICYESVYGDWSAAAVRDGATFLAVITNDGWWGDTPGYHQHFRFAGLRAIENRRDVAHVANTGISGFINQRGDVLQKTGWWVETAIRGEVHTNTRLTFFSRHGDMVGRASQWLCAGLILLLLLSLLWDRISGRGKSASKRL